MVDATNAVVTRDILRAEMAEMRADMYRALWVFGTGIVAQPWRDRRRRQRPRLAPTQLRPTSPYRPRPPTSRTTTVTPLATPSTTSVQ